MFLLCLDIVACRMRESEIAAIINTDVLINGDTAAACSLY